MKEVSFEGGRREPPGPAEDIFGSPRSSSIATFQTSKSQRTFPPARKSGESFYGSGALNAFESMAKDGFVSAGDFASALREKHGDLPLWALVRCFPTCLLREDAQFSATQNKEEVKLSFQDFASFWDSAMEKLFSEEDEDDSDDDEDLHGRLTSISMLSEVSDHIDNCCAFNVDQVQDHDDMDTMGTATYVKKKPEEVQNNNVPPSQPERTKRQVVSSIDFQSRIAKVPTIAEVIAEKGSYLVLEERPPRVATIRENLSFSSLLNEEPRVTPEVLPKKCSFKRRNLRTQESVHLDWEIDGREVRLGKSLGCGKFGVVFEATWRWKPVAVKKLRTYGSGDAEKKRFEKEALLLANMRHPNVLMFIGAVNDEENQSIMVVTERLDMSLHNFLYDLQERKESLSFQEFYSIIEQMCHGLNYLHLSDPTIIHRDIKPKNVLMRFPSVRIVLADFGISTTIDNIEEERVGTLAYMAPELLESKRDVETHDDDDDDEAPISNKKPICPKVDVYALAIVAAECLTIRRPVVSSEGNASNLVAVSYAVCTLGHRPRLPRKTPPDVLRLITNAWAQDATDRPTIEEILAFIRQTTNSKAFDANKRLLASLDDYKGDKKHKKKHIAP